MIGWTATDDLLQKLSLFMVNKIFTFILFFFSPFIYWWPPALYTHALYFLIEWFIQIAQYIATEVTLWLCRSQSFVVTALWAAACVKKAKLFAVHFTPRPLRLHHSPAYVWAAPGVPSGCACVCLCVTKCVHERNGQNEVVVERNGVILLRE